MFLQISHGQSEVYTLLRKLDDFHSKVLVWKREVRVSWKARARHLVIHAPF